MYRRALLIALICAMVAVGLFLLYLKRYEQEASGGERVRLLVALHPLERGKPVTEDALGVREVPLAYVEDRSIRESDKTKILGLRVGGLVQAQETLLWTDLAVASEEHRDLSALVQPGRRATTLHLRDDGTGSMVRPGDYVDVIGVVAANGSPADARAASVLLQRVLVLATGNSTSLDSFDAKPADGRAGGQLTVSVALPEAQLLALAAERGSLSVVLRSPEDGHGADRVPDVTLTSLAGLPARQSEARVAPTELRSEDLRQ